MRTVLAFAGAVALAFPGAAQEAAPWRVDGLILRSDPVIEPVDVDRVDAQQEAGCQDGKVRFADSAAMRADAAAIGWSREQAELGTVGALADTVEVAYSAWQRLLDQPDLSVEQRAIAENHYILSALQFGDISRAETLIAAFGPAPDAPSDLRSDRMFWSVLVEAGAADAVLWRGALSPILDEALALDPASFQVRVWRVVAWFEGRAWQGQACAPALRQLTDIVLDATENNACAVMLGHMSNAISLALASRPDAPPRNDAEAWRWVQDGFVAGFAGHVAARDRAVGMISAGAPAVACRDEMILALGLSAGRR